MNRDGRSTPGRIVLKHQPRLGLNDVLRRRRTTLAILVEQLGISTYVALEQWCNRMGINPPERSEFLAASCKIRNVDLVQEATCEHEKSESSEQTTVDVPALLNTRRTRKSTSKE